MKMKNRLTREDIEAEIVSKHFFTAKHGVDGALDRGELHATYANGNHGDDLLALVTICVLVLRNGFKVVGVNNGPVDHGNFCPEMGRKCAYDNALDQLWPVLGYQLRDAISCGSRAQPSESQSIEV
jgi:hypothetical protein